MDRDPPVLVVCPMCSRADRIQKVRSIIDSGPIYRVDKIPFEDLTFPGNLAPRGKKPVYFEEWLYWTCGLVLFTLPLAWVGLAILLSLVLGGGSVIFYVIPGSLLALAICPLVLAIKGRYRWHKLYYCFRDNCVFISGKNRAVPPEQMRLLL